MVTVYVLRSLVADRRYTGMSKDVRNRLNEHNQGKNRYTKAFMPWEIIYIEEHPNWQVARTREKYLKSASGRKWLNALLQNGGSLPA